jgi:two-component system sensor histidine kinase VicK
MTPAVPFALLGAVQLVAVAAWVALGAAAVVRRGWRSWGFAVPLLLAGLLLLAVVDTRTALELGDASNDLLAQERAAGLLLVAVGLGFGALSGAPVLPQGQLALFALPGVIAPIATTGQQSVLTGVAGALAAAGALRARRDRVGILLALGLLAAGGAGLLAGHVRNDAVALLVVLLRGLAAVLVLAALSALAQRSLLSKVAAGILAGVVLMAAAAVVVVGTVVVRSYDRQTRAVVQDTAAARQAGLLEFSADRALPARLLATGACGTATASGTASTCQQVLALLPPARDFVARVAADGTATVLATRDTVVSPTELTGLSALPPVSDVMSTPVRAGVTQAPVPSLAALTGDRVALVSVSVVADAGRQSDNRPSSALVYGVRIDDDYAQSVVDGESDTFSILFGSGAATVVSATDATPAEQAQVLAAARKAGTLTELTTGRTTGADGLAPTVRFLPLNDAGGDQVATLAVSRDARVALDAQRDALSLLFLTALGTLVVVGGFAVWLGRRTVEPVRQLTAAAQRVAAGDLGVRTATGSLDEVGSLSRTFDAMTDALADLTYDIRTTNERLQLVMTSMSDGLVSTDALGLVTGINRAGLALAGLPDERAALGRPLGEVVPVLDAAGELLTDLTRAVTVADGEVQRPDGTTAAVRVELAALFTEGAERAEGVVLVLRDHARERAIERMKTEFLSNVSHELRTPLTPIRGYADMLRKRELAPDQVKAFAGTIASEARKMNRVVDLLVDVASIEAGRVVLAPRAISPRDLVSARFDVWQDRAGARAVDLKRRVATGLPDVLVDTEWLGKALDELIDNAVKYSPAGTAITLGAEAGPRGSVRVFVADRGPGVSDQDALFSSFEQVDGSATRRVGGLGLGLSFVHRITQLAGVRLGVEGAPGKGAVFAVDLPAVKGAGRSPAKRRPAAPAARGPAAEAPVTKATASKSRATKAPARKTPAAKAPARKAPARKAPAIETAAAKASGTTSPGTTRPAKAQARASGAPARSSRSR